MDVNNTIELAQTLLQQGKTAQTFTLLIDTLSADPRYAGMVNSLRVLEANFAATREEARAGVLTEQEAQRGTSQANRALVAVLAALAAGKTNLAPMAATAGPKRKWSLLFAASAAGGALLAAAFWFFSTKEKISCPNFADGKPKILILPFVNLGDANSAAAADVIVRNRIEEISNRNNFPLSVKILDKYDANKRKPGLEEAQDLLNRCDANMVIWGDYLRENGQPLKVDTRFTLDNRGFGNTNFKAFSTLSELGDSQNDALRSVEEAVFSLCSWMAHAMQRDSIARKWQSKVANKTADDWRLEQVMQQQ